MKDFIEQEASLTSPPRLSQDTPTVSDNLQGTEVAIDNPLDIEEISETMEALAGDRYADPEITAATIATLKPYKDNN